MSQTAASGAALQSSAPASETPAALTRRTYEPPRLTHLGEWTALTLAGSLPIPTGLPLFGK